MPLFCPTPAEIPGMFDLPPSQFVPLWITILLLGVIPFLLLVFVFRVIQLFRGLSQGQEERSLVWLDVLLGVCIVVWGSLLMLLLLWVIAIAQWETRINPQCPKYLMLPITPGTLVGIIMFLLVGAGIWAVQRWYRRTKSRLLEG